MATALSTLHNGSRTGIFHLRGGRIPTTTNIHEIVRQQVVDCVITNSRERVMRPDYGSDIRSLLFDLTDDLVRSDVAATVKTRLELQVPRARFNRVVIINDAIELQRRGVTTDISSTVVIEIEYTTRNITESLAIVIPTGDSA